MALDPNTELHLVNSIDEAMEMKRWLGERREILGLDTETGGLHEKDPLNPYSPTAKLRMVQVGDHRAGWAIPWEQWGGVALEILNAYEGPIAVHNLSFDAAWMELHTGWKVPWNRMHDTMIHYNMLYPGEPASLKHVTDKHIDPAASIGQHQLDMVMKNNGWDWRTIPVDNPEYAMYSALDPVLTAHIWSFLRADQKFPKAFDLEMSALRICTEMEMRGIPVDVEYSKKKRQEIEEYVDSAKKWAKDNLGISITSTQQLAHYFENVLGAPISKRTAGGAPSVDKDTLAEFSISLDHRVANLANLVLDVRTQDKLRSSYFDNFINYNTNGLLHPSIKTMGARTGRMSIRDPALQTLPSNGDIVRMAITAREEGHSIFSSDLDQVEFRILASFSKDPNLINTFLKADATGGDVFTTIGAQVYQDPNFQKSDPRRKLIKSQIYGAIYGASVAKQAQTAKVDVQIMQEVSDALNQAYPGMKSFQREKIREVEEIEKYAGQGYVETSITGRRIPVDAGKAYTGVNYKIQGSASEVLKSNLIRLDSAGLGEYLVVPVHDEIVMSAPTEDSNEIKRIARECMTTTEGWAVPLTAGAEGPYERWGSAYTK